MKIGLVGEAPNDTAAIKNLLSKRYPELTFVYLLNSITGAQLDYQKTQHLLRLENQFQKPDAIIFIRDLDGFPSNRDQVIKRRWYFRKHNNNVQNIGIYLLHIYEIEALILSDIEVFNAEYGTTLGGFGDVTIIPEPKEILLNASKKYSESHNARIFEKLDFDRLLSCSYFREFVNEFESIL